MGLEDDFCDIIKKSRHGQSLSLAAVAEKSHLSQSDVEAIERGVRLPNSNEVDSLSQALNLRSQPLISIVIDEWAPNAVPNWVTQDGLVTTVLGDIGGYEVKGYILTDPQTRESLMIDTGYNPTQMLKTLETHQLKLKGVCLTHGHTDHAGGLDKILARWPVPVYLGNEDVSLLNWTPPQQLLTFPKKWRNHSLWFSIPRLPRNAGSHTRGLLLSTHDEESITMFCRRHIICRISWPVEPIFTLSRSFSVCPGYCPGTWRKYCLITRSWASDNRSRRTKLQSFRINE